MSTKAKSRPSASRSRSVPTSTKTTAEDVGTDVDGAWSGGGDGPDRWPRSGTRILVFQRALERRTRIRLVRPEPIAAVVFVPLVLTRR